MVDKFLSFLGRSKRQSFNQHNSKEGNSQRTTKHCMNDMFISKEGISPPMTRPLVWIKTAFDGSDIVEEHASCKASKNYWTLQTTR